MLLDHFATLLELPIERTELILKEARHKFTDTYMILDGELKYIKEIYPESLFIVNTLEGVQEVNTIKTLVPFLPPTGLYFPNESTNILIQKIASKQWRKSFCWDLYTANIKSFYTPFNVFRAIKENTVEMFDNIVFNNGSIYYLDLLIGKKDSNGVYAVIPEFYQELIDLFGEDHVQIIKKKIKQEKKKSTKEPSKETSKFSVAFTNTDSDLENAPLFVDSFGTINDPFNNMTNQLLTQKAIETYVKNYFKGIIHG